MNEILDDVLITVTSSSQFGELVTYRLTHKSSGFIVEMTDIPVKRLSQVARELMGKLVFLVEERADL